MTDREFLSKIKQAMMAAQKHTSLVMELEEEYERRFGGNPSETDDDFWIDTVHQGHGSMPTLKDIEENAMLHL